ncbi:hypothetical protein BJ964_003317 [Actinoplanes lobatus]|uniref:Uncharacterized protein n=1 Tax=Actinoplanes lobatus TaxID=113568 RepID=A0A7W7HEM6_9ACTN|nr:hypothetical protein [Actinoplanes lobatus]
MIDALAVHTDLGPFHAGMVLIATALIALGLLWRIW